MIRINRRIGFEASHHVQGFRRGRVRVAIMVVVVRGRVLQRRWGSRSIDGGPGMQLDQTQGMRRLCRCQVNP